MKTPVRMMIFSAALAGCVALALPRYASAQEPASQDKLGEGAVGHKKPLPEETGAAPGDKPDPKAGDAKPGDAKPGDAKPGDAKPGDTKPGAGGGRQRGGDAQAGATPPAKDLCGNLKTADAAPGDVLKTAADGDAPPAPTGGGGGFGGGGGGAGGGGRRGRGGAAPGAAAGPADKGAYDYELVGADGKGVPFCTWKGKTVLLVNVARNSAYASQLAGLQKLQDEYKDQGLVVIGVPSDEFGAAEPGKDDEIQKVYKTDDKVTFPIMAKSELTGDKELPFFEWLTKAEGGPIHWNYTKFFLDKTGKPIARFDPAVTPDSAEMQAAVPAILAGRYKAPGTGDAAPTGRRGGGGAPAM